MLTQENDVEIHALAARGWSQSAISRHTGRDRKTVRKYLAAGSVPGRERAASCLEPFRGYLAARFEEDKHVDATVLYRELVAAGFDRSYPTLVREIRRLELRPVCLECQHRRGQTVTVEIDHPPGEEIQWDWLELHHTPWGEPAFVLIGALSHSGWFRAVFCEQMTFGHLAEAAHRVLVGLGGSARAWRTDRMATIVIPGTDRLTVDAANIAKHYGVEIAVCPPRRAQRKGVVEAAVKYTTKSWWRTAAVSSPAEAQASLDRWSLEVADRRSRPGGTVGEIGCGEPLRALPALAYPAMIAVQRRASRSALVAFEAEPLQRSARARRTDGDGPGKGRGARPADRVDRRRDRRDTPPRPGRHRADDPNLRARRAAAAGSARRVHYRPCVPDKGEPAARERSARSARAPPGP